MNDVSRTIELPVPAWAWETVSVGLRRLRELHREAGGTSRMVKSGMTVSLTITGPPKAVAASTEFAEGVRAVVTAMAARRDSSAATQRRVIDDLLARVGAL